jgi:hypothetical protein
MQHAAHLRDTAFLFLFIGLFIRYWLPHKKGETAEPKDMSWYSLVIHWIRTYLAKGMAHTVSSFLVYSGIFMLLLALF